MAIDQNIVHSNQIEHNDKIADAAKASSNKIAEQGKQIADAARDAINKMVDLREQATENTKQIVQKSVEAASYHAREATERLTRTAGFTGEDRERLPRQS